MSKENNVTSKQFERPLRKDVKPDGERQNFCYLGDKCRNTTVYKYLNLESVLLCLENSNIRFQQPSEWPDKYESLFYNATYDRLGISDDLHPKLFACCFTTAKMSEAAWKVYSYDKNGLAHRCVKLAINLNKLRDALNDYGKKNGFKVYESLMDYSLNDEEIINLHKKSSPYYAELFDNFDGLNAYLSLLVIKRKAFSYENELRFFLVPDDCHKNLETIEDVTLSLSNLIESIAVDDKCSDMEMNILKVYCKNHEVNVEIKKEKLYYCPNGNLEIAGEHEIDNDKVLSFIRKNPECTKTDMRKALNISKSLLQRRLLEYKNKGLVDITKVGVYYKWKVANEKSSEESIDNFKFKQL